MEVLSVNTNELVRITNINKKIWFMLKKNNLMHPALIGRSLIWDIDEIKTFLEWSKGQTITNEFDLVTALETKPYPKKPSRNTR